MSDAAQVVAADFGVVNTELPNTLVSITGNVNSYTQVTLLNKSTGADATADYIVTADNGSDTSNYIDLGINGSQYSVSGWSINGADDGYLYNNDGGLAIGTANTTLYITPGEGL